MEHVSVPWLFVSKEKSPDYWWYDTLAVFPAGIWFSILKKEFDALSLNGRILLYIPLIAVFILWRHYIGIDDYGICAIIFTLALTAVTTFVKFDNPILQWLGINSFYIIILHRIPITALSHTALINYPLVFSGVALIATLLLSWLFGQLTKRLDALIFS